MVNWKEISQEGDPKSKTSQMSNVQENASELVKNGFSFVSDWLRKWHVY